MPNASVTSPQSSSAPRWWPFWTFIALLVMLGWDAWGQDQRLAHWFGTEAGFPLREQWFLVQVMHEGGRRLGWVLALCLVLAIWWPVGMLKRLDMAARVQMAVSLLVSLAVISLFKQASTTSCPWDLAEFGGAARYASHWAWGVLDGGGGRCFPAGHASAGFAFIGGYFALRRQAPLAARWWLAVALGAGLALGWGQQMRGAHFMSHTLWTGWLCWCAGWLCDVAAQWRRRNKATQPLDTVSAGG